VLDQAELVVSELVTNAVSHGNSGCEVRIGLTDNTLRIEVTDRGAGTPDVLATTGRDEHGRGLVLVSAVAAAWGVDTTPGDGKVVWAHLALPAA
jgi:anti-sigma regulatory factor (Ser/Thr protein kinase)